MTPYHYVLNNPLRYTDITGDTVDVDPKLLEPVVYTEGENKGDQKGMTYMTPSEKQRYFFQQWWASKGDRVNKLFGIGGQYETTNISFKLSGYPRTWGILSLGSPDFIGHTGWGKQGTDEGSFYHGGGLFDGGDFYSEGTVNPDFGIDKLQINVYFHPKFSRNRLYTAPHEWKHVNIIFDAVKSGRSVPNGMRQEEMIK